MFKVVQTLPVRLEGNLSFFLAHRSLLGHCFYREVDSLLDSFMTSLQFFGELSFLRFQVLAGRGDFCF